MFELDCRRGGQEQGDRTMRFEVLHWLPQQDRWEPIDWDDWQAFAGDVWCNPPTTGY